MILPAVFSQDENLSSDQFETAANYMKLQSVKLHHYHSPVPSPGRSVLKIHFSVELGQNMTQFKTNTEYSFKKIFVQ